ncbi:MAG: hypothetical protein FJ100_06710 [Deltaproteobacteria bacterium]|nr:hypothetical protein [Deltaproteobacteria bacterium]
MDGREIGHDGALDLDDLAACAPWPAERARAAGGRCRSALVEGWRDLVPAAVAAAVTADLAADGLPLGADAGSWLPLAGWLRLHDHLAARLCDGDRPAFGRLWLAEVGVRVPWLGRAGLRALGLRGAVRYLPAVWSAGFDLPAPAVTVADDAVHAVWRGHPAFAVPTFRWLVALQGALLAPACGGWRAAGLRAGTQADRFEITWFSREP